jgi:hypothetical protein
LESKFSKPKRASEILDHTFTLTKTNFKNFFLLMLIFMGPVFLIQVIIELASGKSFLKETGVGNTWYERLASSIAERGSIDTGAIDTSAALGLGIGLIVIALIGFLVFPVAEAAILIAVNHIRKNEDYTIGAVIKQAFSRFWPILGSNFLFFLIVFGLILVPIIAISVIAAFTSESNGIAAVLIAILLGLGALVGIGLLITRWSFYFGSVVLDKKSPGLGRSWRLTRKRTWALIGLYIVFYLIVTIVSSTVQTTFAMSLGDSVLVSIITNLVSLITTMLFSVGYSVMYLDAKTRHDADDLKEMIADYGNAENVVE